MPGLEPIVTAHPLTGAFRPVTPTLLAETYLAPRAHGYDIDAALAGPGHLWSESLAVAPHDTAAVVVEGLRSLALATPTLSPDDVDLSRLDPGTRVARHAAALLALWRDHPALLPEDLAVMAHVIACGPEDALEPLPLVEGAPCAFAAPAEAQLHAALLAHHGLASDVQRTAWRERQAPFAAGAPEGSSLWRVQQGLTGGAVGPGPLDDTVAFFALRDEAEEAEFAAARAQRLIEEGAAPQEIALLAPDEPGYHAHLDRAFRALGVPLSGLPGAPQRRDVASETLLHLLLCLQTPAPAMALASLYISPLAPWPAEIGAQLARDVMRGRFEPSAAKALTGRAGRLFALLRAGTPQTGAGVGAALEQAASLLSQRPEDRDDVAALRARLPVLRAILDAGDAPDWSRLFGAATPSPPAARPAERIVEGVSVFTEGAAPWRPARHLIALGMSGARWPRPSPSSALFLDSELELLRARAGLRIETRGEAIARRLERLRRQILAATGSLTLLRPVFGPDGARQPPAAALSLVARTIGEGGRGTEDAETLLRDPRALPPARRPCAARTAAPVAGVAPPPASGVLALGHDLLRLRRAEDGRMRPQSPSRLETLMVSPMAWALAEFGAGPVAWSPETLDVMLAGTLAHAVLEDLFPKDAPLAPAEVIAAQTPELLGKAIRRYAPFLQRTIWAVERESLIREIRTAALAWRDTLERLGAAVIDNEIDLYGAALGIRLHGRADCLLRLPDGALLIVDHKKSGTAARRARMEAGWDLQLGLYRAMLQAPERTGAVLDAALGSGPRIGVAYHLINDQGVLAHGLAAPPGVVTAMQTDISHAAIDQVATRLGEVSAGLIRLNTDADRAFFEKTAKLKPYALDASPLVARFMTAQTDHAEDGEDRDD